MKRLLFFLILILSARITLATLTITTDGGASNVTATTATIGLSLKFTNAPAILHTNYFAWGTVDQGTDIFSYAHIFTNLQTTAFGTIQTNLTGLPTNTKHYYNVGAKDVSNGMVTASSSIPFRTLVSTIVSNPINGATNILVVLPAGSNVGTLMVNGSPVTGGSSGGGTTNMATVLATGPNAGNAQTNGLNNLGSLSFARDASGGATSMAQVVKLGGGMTGGEISNSFTDATELGTATNAGNAYAGSLLSTGTAKYASGFSGFTTVSNLIIQMIPQGSQSTTNYVDSNIILGTIGVKPTWPSGNLIQPIINFYDFEVTNRLFALYGMGVDGLGRRFFLGHYTPTGFTDDFNFDVDTNTWLTSFGIGTTAPLSGDGRLTVAGNTNTHVVGLIATRGYAHIVVHSRETNNTDSAVNGLYIQDASNKWAIRSDDGTNLVIGTALTSIGGGKYVITSTNVTINIFTGAITTIGNVTVSSLIFTDNSSIGFDNGSPKLITANGLHTLFFSEDDHVWEIDGAPIATQNDNVSQFPNDAGYTTVTYVNAAHTNFTFSGTTDSSGNLTVYSPTSLKNVFGVNPTNDLTRWGNGRVVATNQVTLHFFGVAAANCNACTVIGVATGSP